MWRGPYKRYDAWGLGTGDRNERTKKGARSLGCHTRKPATESSAAEVATIGSCSQPVLPFGSPRYSCGNSHERFLHRLELVTPTLIGFARIMKRTRARYKHEDWDPSYHSPGSYGVVHGDKSIKPENWASSRARARERAQRTLRLRLHTKKNENVSMWYVYA